MAEPIIPFTLILLCQNGLYYCLMQKVYIIFDPVDLIEYSGRVLINQILLLCISNAFY